MGFIPHDVLLPVLAIDLLLLLIVILWPEDINVKVKIQRPPPEEEKMEDNEEDDEPPPPHDGMAAA